MHLVRLAHLAVEFGDVLNELCCCARQLIRIRVIWIRGSCCDTFFNEYW